MTLKTCSQCNAPFECGGLEAQRCWCFDIPQVFSLPADLTQNNSPTIQQDCFCPECLKAKYEQKISEVANKEYLKAEPDFYINAQGFTVFTQAFHLKRGYCCKNSCKHCPY